MRGRQYEAVLPSVSQHLLGLSLPQKDLLDQLVTYISRREHEGKEPLPILQLAHYTGYLIKCRLLNSVSTLICLLYTSPSPRDQRGSRMPSSA